jgi:hypothetical protein
VTRAGQTVDSWRASVLVDNVPGINTLDATRGLFVSNALNNPG